ncbi:mononuclear molybdenum enzyme YedY, partial [Marinomonas sp. 42_23_T18]
MLIKIKKTSDISEHQVTDQAIYLNRRQFMRNSALSVAALSGASHALAGLQEGNLISPPTSLASAFNNIQETHFGMGEKIAPFDVASSYNNF